MTYETKPLQTAVALTLFNRIEDTVRILEAIGIVQPTKLFLIADAGRNEAEQARCVATRRAVEAAIDWPCEVFKNYSDTNMGAKMRLATGITWVFEHVDRAIILEHDCLPSSDFFSFCDELLERYKDDERVMHISGDNFQQKNPDFVCKESYYFSRIPHIWGFATWARAWKHYDVNVPLWPEADKHRWLANIFRDPAVRDRWEYRFAQYYRQEIESWDGQWVFACVINSGLCINPCVNLVSNIGFDSNALTTKDPNHRQANLPIIPIEFPLSHPSAILPDEAVDAYTYKHVFEVNRNVRSKIIWFLKSRVPGPYHVLKNVFSRTT